MDNIFLEECKSLLDSAQISKVLNLIISNADKLELYDISDKAKKIEQNLSSMTDYFAIGIEDPSRSDILASIFDDAYQLIDLFEVTQKNVNTRTNLSTIDLSDRDALFDAIENNFPSNREDRKFIQQLILNDANPLYLRGMALSALTLNLLQYFDNDKFESLYSYTFDDLPVAIRSRAWVAIVLVSMAHNDRIATQPRLVEQLKFFCEEGGTNGGNGVLSAIQTALLLSQAAQKTQTTIKKLITDAFQSGYEKIEANKKSMESNEMILRRHLENSGVFTKIIDFLNKQTTGLDIMYETFMVTSKCPFFACKSNWFLPFDENLPDLGLSMSPENSQTFLKILNKSNALCSTDKYSYYNLFLNIPQEQLGNLTVNIDGSGFNLSDVPDPSLDEAAIDYIHDLYRYYTLFRKNSESYNPFDKNLNFSIYFGLNKAIPSSKEKMKIVNILIDNELWTPACEVLDEVVKEDDSEDCLLKFAYCLKCKSPTDQSVLSVLSKCYGLHPNTTTLKEYVNALIENEDYYMAEKLLRDAMQLYPDDKSLIILLADSFVKDYRYEEAIELLFKADIIEEDSYETTRKLAYCALMLGNKDVAEKYISKTLNMNSANENDWILGGHIALLNRNTKLAIDRYNKGVDNKNKASLIYDYSYLADTEIPYDLFIITIETVLKMNNIGK